MAYCREVLHVALTPPQEAICRAIVEPPHRVLCRAAHNVGKSFIAACLVNWWFDVHDKGIVLTTAPTARQVQSILWKEIRVLRGRRGGFPWPKICRLESGPEHWAEGFTSRDGTRFQGHHAESILIVFDEAEGIDSIFWEAAGPMLGGDHYAFLAIYNPTSQTSPTVEEERSGSYKVLTMSALEHPNIAAELAGQPVPFPAAIRLERLEEMLQRWSQPIPDGEQPLPGDVQLRDRWYRPGPVAEARLLGRRPSLAFDSVWSEFAFDLVCRLNLPAGGPLQIGCDVARFGDDDTCWHIRKGGVSLGHERVNGYSTVQTARRTELIALEYATRFGLDSRQVIIAVDDCGVGGGVTDLLRADGFAVVGVNVATVAPDETEYPNLRSCLWFEFAETAAQGNVSFANLDEPTRQQLRRELLAPKYCLDIRGRRVVEPKSDTKARLGYSPDAADALHLAYYNVNVRPDRVGEAVRVPG